MMILNIENQENNYIITSLDKENKQLVTSKIPKENIDYKIEEKIKEWLKTGSSLKL
jgi:hypothetical protein